LWRLDGVTIAMCHHSMSMHAHNGKITSSYVALTVAFFVGVEEAGIKEYI